MGTEPKKIAKQCCAIFITVFFSSWILADSGGDVLSDVLIGLINLLTSGPARLLFIIVIIGVGYGTLALGRIPKEKAIAVVVGIGIVFSASYYCQ